jgi:hypothetical protein
MIEWPKAVLLWNRGYSTYAIAKEFSYEINEVIHESVIYNGLPFWREKLKENHE